MAYMDVKVDLKKLGKLITKPFDQRQKPGWLEMVLQLEDNEHVFIHEDVKKLVKSVFDVDLTDFNDYIPPSERHGNRIVRGSDVIDVIPNYMKSDWEIEQENARKLGDYSEEHGTILVQM